MIHSIRLGAVLYCVWLLLSGRFSPLLLLLGVASVVVVTVISLRMKIIDHHSYPIRLNGPVLSYWCWLAWEIVKSNLQVARCILDPGLPISPCITRVKASQTTPLGIVTYANGITLTPGTVSIAVDGDTIEVHALTREACRGVEDGEMDRRVTAMGRAG
jgi:multicomponent Na+:H+ antiporter subunit E